MPLAAGTRIGQGVGLAVAPNDAGSQSQLQVVVNWFEELKRLVPAK